MHPSGLLWKSGSLVKFPSEVLVDRSQKETVVDEIREIFNNAAAGVLVDYRGLEANKIVELRQQLRNSASTMKVLKNTLARIASEGTPFGVLEKEFVETCALVYSPSDPVGQAKILTEFAKTNPQLVIKAGVLSDANRAAMLNAGEVEALAKLPSREELIVKVLFVLQAPSTQFVRTLNEVPAKFVRTLAAVAESKSAA